MLQYPVQLPPLSLSSNRDNDYFRSNDFNSINRRRIQKDSSRHHHLSISTNLSPSSDSSSPSTTSAKLPRSPYISSRALHSSSPVPFAHQALASPDIKSSSSSIGSQTLHDVLAPGDIVGEGFYLQDDVIRLVSHSEAPLSDSEPASEFEVIKQLGTGSYAVVYLVQEVLARPTVSDDGHMSTIGPMEFEGRSAISTSPAQTVYGRKYAIKCLSKANLDEDALAIQMSEVTIHQSLRLHPNIVALHRTLETSAFLLLLLEYVPGEDLFYFLEQSRDHYDLDSAQPTDSSVSTSYTPPTPSLLSNLHPSQLLSRTRLRLIASMFAQMCDAVAACHAQQVFHRDIKPENFIVTDGTWTTSDGRLERKVFVKLTDFGLSTTDLDSSDMDCGSAPYMSYECRNNVAPTYRPRAADVWSLGIVLINMLYHFNPWTDTRQGACSSFDLYRRDPINFFMQRFTGMTRPVAEVFATKVFCILEDQHDDSLRMGAAEFGAWAKNLPTLLGGHGVHRTVSNSSTQGHRLSLSIPISHRPSSRHPSVCTSAARGTPSMPTRTLSRAPSLEPAFEREELSTVIDQDNEDDVEEQEQEDVDIEGMTSRSTSTNKRRKRGARKGKGLTSAASPIPVPQDVTLDTLAVASLAREISMASKSPSKAPSTGASVRSTSTKTTASSKRARVPFEPVSMYAMPTALLSNTRSTSTSARSPQALVSPPPSATITPAATTTPVLPKPVTKKPSKWKLSFGKNSGSSALAASAAAEEVPPVPSPIDLSHMSPPVSPAAMSTTASNVTNLLMGLDAPPPPHSAPASKSPYQHSHSNFGSSSNDDAHSSWSRGRRGVRDVHYSPGAATIKNHSRSPGYALSAASSATSLHHPHRHTPPVPPLPSHHDSRSPMGSYMRDTRRSPERAVSPNSTRTGRGAPITSSASSMVSSNWRSSMSTTSSAGTSTSAFTRYSNSSARSISTTATSVSSASWRTSVKPSSTFSSVAPSSTSPNSYAAGGIPKNIKIMDGVPWELGQLPRGQHPSPVGDIFGSPPIRKQRTRKPPKDLKLDTITERPAGGLGSAPVSSQKSPDYLRRDASTSTTDLESLPTSPMNPKDDVDGVKKVQKGQINALAKMLSALRR